ncbi:GNAT family N-acetyltransferase [Natrialba swarupiae]|uniref:GNAT family N-acetyltransferase n=1 Tax=Natrialba swarupiae TaxID=2448032 RepID=A0A5D5ARR7_9EURY|nr:GNAT family N-acetyltransferase [Natrialba swarupiae]TYT62522.1 GNAT family N-acetyltransferase [Natrialba swarupiae]
MSRDVRQATADDVDAIHETARRSWHAAYDEILEARRIDEIVDEWYAISDLESSIANASSRDDVVFLVADGDADAPIPRFEDGCIGFAHAIPWPEGTSVAFLVRVYVDPEAWGNGIGSRLLATLEEKLADRFDRIRLAVLADNHVGVSFYESSGFDRIETRESELSEGLEEYVYQKPL